MRVPVSLLLLGLSIVSPRLSAGQASQTPPASPSQTNQAPGYTLQSQSNVVLLPTQVELKHTGILYTLRADQFVVEDNGVPQKIKLDEDTDALGLSLVVAIQCSRSAAVEFQKTGGLATMIDAITGGAPSEVAIVSFGDEPELDGDFTSDPDAMRTALSQLQPCDDPGAATLDAVDFSAKLLEKRNNHYRHAILLISESRDHGSKIKPEKVVAELGRTNSVVDSVAFSPGKTEILRDLKYGGGSGPIGLLIMAVNGLKHNAPKELSALSGGEYINFDTQNEFDNGLGRLSNHIHNYYLLSFQSPADAAPGMHSLKVKIPDYPEAEIRTRESYFVGNPDAATIPSK
jgi:VWFA-related protein